MFSSKQRRGRTFSFSRSNNIRVLFVTRLSANSIQPFAARVFSMCIFLRASKFRTKYFRNRNGYNEKNAKLHTFFYWVLSVRRTTFVSWFQLERSLGYCCKRSRFKISLHYFLIICCLSCYFYCLRAAGRVLAKYITPLMSLYDLLCEGNM